MILALSAAACSRGSPSVPPSGSALCGHVLSLNSMIGATLPSGIKTVDATLVGLRADAQAFAKAGEPDQARAVNFLIGPLSTFRAQLASRTDAGVIDVFPKRDIPTNSIFGVSGAQRARVQRGLLALPQVQSATWSSTVFVVRLRVFMTFPQIERTFGSLPGVDQVSP